MKNSHKGILVLVWLVLILVMMGSALWSQWGILLLDYLSAPNAPLHFTWNGWYWVPQVFVHTIGFEWGTKVAFAGILTLGIWLGFLIGNRLASLFAPKYRLTLMILWGIFFVVNPFAYERMMVQPVIYLGVILLGYALYFLLGYQGYKKWLFFGIASGIAINLFLHASFMVALILGVYGLFCVRKWEDFVGIGLAGLCIVCLNLNWILPPLIGVPNSVNSINTFDMSNFQAFLTNALAPMNVWGTNILLYGFWGERSVSHYVNVGFLSSLWYVAGGILVMLMWWALYRLFREASSRKYAMMAALCSVLSLIFAVGIASSLTEGLTLWMVDTIPLWQWYREPQKWIGVLMMIEWALFIVAIALLLKRYGSDVWVHSAIVTSLLLLFLVWTPWTLFGYKGQLKTTVYPEDFSTIRSHLLEKAPSAKVLALPWHSYLGCSWTGRPTVANPIQGLMHPVNVTLADNVEVMNILYSNSTNPESKMIESFLQSHQMMDIASIGFSHILLMHSCGNSASYEWLETIPECEKTINLPLASLYQCEESHTASQTE